MTTKYIFDNLVAFIQGLGRVLMLGVGGWEEEEAETPGLVNRLLVGVVQRPTVTITLRP